MNEHLTPQAHSLVGGSTAARRIGCPRSLVLEPLVPADTGSIYAREGTALHEIMAKVVAEDVEPYSLLPFTFEHEATATEPAWSFTVTEDLWDELGEPALAAFDKFILDLEEEKGEAADLLVEQRCSLPGIEGAFGTTDIVGRCGDIAFVWDWKFGSGPVAAIGNEQLLFYARAAQNDNPEMFEGVTEVWLCIMQPKISDQPDVWRADPSAPEIMRQQLVAAVREADEKGQDARVEKGHWCRFAPCRAICPLHAGVGIALGEKLASLGHIDNKGKPRLTAIDFAEDLPALLEAAEAAREWVAALQAAAHNFAEGGGAIPGYKLVEKRSSGRDWTRDEEKIKQWFSRNGIPVNEYAPRKLVTPPAAEKILKAYDKELPPKLYEAKPSSGTSLVKEDSPRPAVATAADTARALSARLEKYRAPE